MKPTPDSAYGAPLKGAMPAARQSRFRGIPGIGLRRFHGSLVAPSAVEQLR
jgi:hypothetical protein